MENKKNIFTSILILFLITIIILPISNAQEQTNTTKIINNTQNITQEIKQVIPIPSHIRQLSLMQRMEITRNNNSYNNIKQIFILQKREEFKQKSINQIKQNNNKYIKINRTDLKSDIRNELKNKDNIINTKDRIKAEDPRRFPHIERQIQKELREKANARNK